MGLPGTQLVEFYRLLVAACCTALEAPGAIGCIPLDLIVLALADDEVAAGLGMAVDTLAVGLWVIVPVARWRFGFITVEGVCAPPACHGRGP